jgi:hypothetical protein
VCTTRPTLPPRVGINVCPSRDDKFNSMFTSQPDFTSTFTQSSPWRKQRAISCSRTSKGTLLITVRMLLSLTISHSFLNAKEFSDLSITCGNDTYDVHKLVVCTRSDFFATAIKFPGKVSVGTRIQQAWTLTLCRSPMRAKSIFQKMSLILSSC